MSQVASLVVGGALGTLARYGLSEFTHRILGRNLPMGTLAVNLLGCFFVGFLSIYIENRLPLNAHIRLMAMVGFCGAFTTFSTFMMESVGLAKNGQLQHALGYILLSVVAGLLLFILGVAVGNRF